MGTIDKETDKLWKTKAREKSFKIKALEKEKKRLQTQGQSYREMIKQLKLEIATLQSELATKTDEIGNPTRNVKKKMKAI